MNNVIIVAAGMGIRMGHDLPKQFLEILNKPILMHSIEVFYKFDPTINIVVALHSNYREYWQNLCIKHNFTIKHVIVNGGATRFDSVKNALMHVSDGMVAVHDGARPLVSTELIKKCFELSVQHKAVIPALKVTDSLRKLDKAQISKPVDRSEYRTVQTPQVFDVHLLRMSYQMPYKDTFTDDASVVEASGNYIHLVEGESRNIKITNPIDLKLAEFLLTI